MTDTSWSKWQPYDNWKPDSNSFKETLDGGQAFCWNAIDAYTYEGVVQARPFRIRWKYPHSVSWSACAKFLDEADALIGKYIGSQNVYQNYYDALPWRSDRHLKRCMDAFPQLRILRQPAEETLLGFLCSPTKQIVQIKEMLALLRDRFGTQLASGHKSLPTWAQLLKVDEMALRECKLGFRAAHIKKTASLLKENGTILTSLDALSYEEAKRLLCTLPGVGGKVADCTLLFGYHQLAAFPVDTWIVKVMKRHYGLAGWSPKQVAHFGRTHFGDEAGLAQQFLFAWERSDARK